jgi:NitT/TauT family transport system permease protein
LLGFSGLAVFLVLWQVGAEVGWVNQLFFSSPVAIVQAGVTELQLPRFWGDVRQSALEFLIGFGVASILAIPLGLAFGWYRPLGDLFEPWMTFFYALPRIALIPIILMWIGLSVWSIIIMAFLGGFFQILFNTAQGPRMVDLRLARVSRSFHASDRFTFITLVFPSSIPFILTGLRLGVSRAITGVVVGEFFASTSGLGHMIFLASSSLQTARLLFATLFLITIGVLTVEGIHRVETRYSTWRDDLSTSA